MYNQDVEPCVRSLSGDPVPAATKAIKSSKGTQTKARRNHKRIRRRTTFKLPKTKSRPIGTWVVGR